MAQFTAALGLKTRPFTLALAAGLIAVAGFAHAGEIAAYAGKTIELKDVRGTVYYAPKGESFEVVTTLDADGHVFRVVSSLKSGQSATLSAPGAIGEETATVEIKREGDHLFVVDLTRQHRADVPTGRRAD